MKTVMDSKKDYSIITRITELAKKGDRIYKDAEMRCEAVDKSVNELCRESGVSVATLWRMKHGSVFNVRTLLKLERVLAKWERVHRA